MKQAAKFGAIVALFHLACSVYVYDIDEEQVKKAIELQKNRTEERSNSLYALKASPVSCFGILMNPLLKNASLPDSLHRV